MPPTNKTKTPLLCPPLHTHSDGVKPLKGYSFGIAENPPLDGVKIFPRDGCVVAGLLKRTT